MFVGSSCLCVTRSLFESSIELSKTMLAEITNSPAIAGFISEVIAVVVLMQVVFNLLLWVLVPVHFSMSGPLGPWGAICACAVLIILLAHVIGLVLTIPALHGVRLGKIQVEKTANVKDVIRDMPLVCLNCLISLFVCSMALLSTGAGDIEDITAGLPDRCRLALQSVVSLLVSEIVFYHVHRSFHENKRLYALVHKIHHTWTAPIAIMGTYAHPLEHVFCNLTSILLGPLLCRAHPMMTLSYLLLFAVGAFAHHSGYWSDDLGMHDLHHQLFNVNYGNAHILDFLYGTYMSQGRCHSRVSKP